MKACDLFLSAFAFALVSPLARAAEGPSFDCAKAGSVGEKTICADPALQAQDRALASAYRAASGKLSPEGRAALLNGQRQWLAMIGAVCAGPPDFHFKDARQCLKSEYEERRKRLETAVTVSGGLEFHRVDIYKLRKVDDPKDNSGSHAGFLTTDKSYPRIDLPKNASERAFNKSLRDQSAEGIGEEGGTDEDFGYDDLAATARLISVRTTGGFYAHGAAHGQHLTSTVNWLRAEGRELRASDVFAPGTPWLRVLREHCFAEVAHYGFVKNAAELDDIVSRPSSWTLGPKGLTVLFNSYQVASYADGRPEVTIPWDVLRPYLAATAPVPGR